MFFLRVGAGVPDGFRSQTVAFPSVGCGLYDVVVVLRRPRHVRVTAAARVYYGRRTACVAAVVTSTFGRKGLAQL